ncbi:MAG: HEAT repeat domain-containing protein [Candidatus Korobacteraceae bacterium]
MSKSDPIETALNRLGELRTAPPELAARELRSYLGNRSNLVVAKAAKIAGELRVSELKPDLVAAFHRFMKNPQQMDKRCAALTEITAALYEMDYREPEIYRQGLRHIQREASFGLPTDAAAALRGMSAQGLVRTRYADALADVVQLLVDPEAPARLGAIRALASNGGDAGVLLLRLKILTGDAEPEVLGECFAGLLAAAPEQSLDFVAQYVGDDDDAISEAAIWALGESRLPAAFEMLKEKWQRTVDRSSRKVLLAAMAASRSEEAIEFLRSLLESESPQTASDVVAALAMYKGNESIKQSIGAIVRGRGDKRLIETFEREFAG